MFARFDENPAMTLRVIKETKRYGRTDARTDGRTDNVKTVYPLQTKFAGGIIIIFETVWTLIMLVEMFGSDQDPNSLTLMVFLKIFFWQFDFENYQKVTKDHEIFLLHAMSEIIIFVVGRVPMRRLVYRVQPLPQSLLPLVWDFGQLNTQVEDLYIRQMVRRYVSIL